MIEVVWSVYLWASVLKALRLFDFLVQAKDTVFDWKEVVYILDNNKE